MNTLSPSSYDFSCPKGEPHSTRTFGKMTGDEGGFVGKWENGDRGMKQMDNRYNHLL